MPSGKQSMKYSHPPLRGEKKNIFKKFRKKIEK